MGITVAIILGAAGLHQARTAGVQEVHDATRTAEVQEMQDAILKLSFNPATGDIASDQMTQIIARLDAMKVTVDGVKVTMDGVVAENTALKQDVAALKASVEARKDTVDEDSGTVVAGNAFCSAWGSTMELFTYKSGSCDFPTVWRADVILEGWMVPLMKYVTKIIG